MTRADGRVESTSERGSEAHPPYDAREPATARHRCGPSPSGDDAVRERHTNTSRGPREDVRSAGFVGVANHGVDPRHIHRDSDPAGEAVRPAHSTRAPTLDSRFRAVRATDTSTGHSPRPGRGTQRFVGRRVLPSAGNSGTSLPPFPATPSRGRRESTPAIARPFDHRTAPVRTGATQYGHRAVIFCRRWALVGHSTVRERSIRELTSARKIDSDRVPRRPQSSTISASASATERSATSRRSASSRFSG